MAVRKLQKPRLVSTDKRCWFYKKQKTDISLASYNLKTAGIEWVIAVLEWVEQWITEKL